MFRSIAAGTGIVILVVVSLAFLWSLIFGFQWITAPFRGALDMREQVQASGDFRIHSYQHFYNLCASIQEAEAMHDSQHELLQTMEQGTERYERQQRVVAVQKANIEQQKRRYNADAAQEETLAAFRSNDVPHRIDVIEHEPGRRTTCTWQD